MKTIITHNIDRIRQKPPEIRRRHARQLAAITTAFIVVIWLFIRVLMGDNEPRTLFDTQPLHSLFSTIAKDAEILEANLEQEKEYVNTVRDELISEKEQYTDTEIPIPVNLETTDTVTNQE